MNQHPSHMYVQQRHCFAIHGLLQVTITTISPKKLALVQRTLHHSLPKPTNIPQLVHTYIHTYIQRMGFTCLCTDAMPYEVSANTNTAETRWFWPQ